MNTWDSVVPLKDRDMYKRLGFTQRITAGNNECLLIIDVVESFTGTRRQDIEKAQNEYITSCGESAWDAIDSIKIVLNYFRSRNKPVIYVKGNPANKYFCGGSIKMTLGGDTVKSIHNNNVSINKEIFPLKNEYVLEKTKASAFFGTPLVTYLNQNDIDTIYVVGCVTSGCVKATVIDGFSYGFKIFVIEEGVFDRSEFMHSASLYEMQIYYADVVSIENVLGKTATEQNLNRQL